MPGACARGTDATDCGTPIIIDPLPPVEVERLLGLSKRDHGKIRRNLKAHGYDVTEGRTLDSSSVRRAIRDWQRDEGYEPTGYLTRDTADELLRRVGPDGCRYARNETCDEPDRCPRGTDTTDCENNHPLINPIITPPPPPPPPQLYCCNPYTGIRVCPIVMPGMALGQLCMCTGVFGYGYGLVCP